MIAKATKIITIDDEFIMKRQEQMARTLNFIKEGAQVVKIDQNSGWGIS